VDKVVDELKFRSVVPERKRMRKHGCPQIVLI
jgi:hypothetical protein